MPGILEHSETELPARGGSAASAPLGQLLFAAESQRNPTLQRAMEIAETRPDLPAIFLGAR